MQKLDLVIQEGHVIDTKAGIDEIRDIGIKNGRIVKIDTYFDSERTVDARGCIVSPGLIDSHVHVFDKGCDLGIPADLVMLPQGITTVGEGGSCGISNYRIFAEMLGQMRVHGKMLINVSPEGLATFQHSEIIRPESWNRDAFKRAFDLYKRKLMGLKLRLSDEVVGKNGLRVLEEALKLAEELQTRLVVHVTATSIPQEEIVKRLRKGDIYCHVYQGYGETILDSKGNVKEEIFDASRRGVILDAASGKNNFSFKVAKRALIQGLLPDVICSDVSSMNYLGEYVGNGLPYIMSKFLALGMNITEILKRTTENPAKVMGIQNELGSLQEGYLADIAVFKIQEGKYTFIDAHREKLEGMQMVLPQATISRGELIWRTAY